jgi:hypothetical protein
MNNRSARLLLCLMLVLGGCSIWPTPTPASGPSASAPPAVQAVSGGGGDPLASWNDGAEKQAIFGKLA